MNKIFESIGNTRVPKSAFDLSHERKLSARFGELIPVYMDEVLPSDQFKTSSELMLRMAPMIAPIMHRVNVSIHYFFVPTRIIWEQFPDFITGGREGTSAPSVPTTTSSIAKNSLSDYLGLPIYSGGGASPMLYSLLPHRAYQQIYNDYYRDQNLTPEVDITDIGTALTMRTRAWEKDYFTSALPWAQRGAAVTVPVTGEGSPVYDDQSHVEKTSGGPAADGDIKSAQAIGDLEDVSGNDIRIENIEKILLDNAEVDINDLRTSTHLQRWLERQARGGARLIETIWHQFGQKSSDGRLQRAEYLGGGVQPLVISEVLNTSGTATESQGNMAGHGISVGQTNSFSKTFEEHGYVFGIMSILPKPSYQQGLARLWTRFDKLDYYWPEFANLGEQAILNKELYYDNALTDNEDTFGYQQRYAEYKYAPNTVHGEFRDTLDYWHLGRIFAARPNLNAAFIEADPSDRIFAVTGAEQFYCQVFNSVKARRPMPFFSDPSLR